MKTYVWKFEKCRQSEGFTITVNENEIINRINFYKGSINGTESKLDQYPSINYPVIYLGLASESENIALYYCLLRDKTEAIQWFSKSSEYYKHSLIEQRSRIGLQSDEASVCVHYLKSAVLSSNHIIWKDASRTCGEINKEFPVKYSFMAYVYYYVQAISDILIGDDAGARSIVDKVSVGAPQNRKKQYGGLNVCLNGILSGEKGTFLAGLDQVLESQKKIKKLGPPDEMLCVPAAVQIKLAEMRGMKIKPEDVKEKYRPYIPWLLFE